MVLYIAYLPDKLLMNTPIKIYNVLQQRENIITFQDFYRIFPPIRSSEIWTTPTGHLFHYGDDLKWTKNLETYNYLIKKGIEYEN